MPARRGEAISADATAHTASLVVLHFFSALPLPDVPMDWIYVPAWIDVFFRLRQGLA